MCEEIYCAKHHRERKTKEKKITAHLCGETVN